MDPQRQPVRCSVRVPTPALLQGEEEGVTSPKGHIIAPLWLHNNNYKGQFFTPKTSQFMFEMEKYLVLGSKIWGILTYNFILSFYIKYQNVKKVTN